MKETELDSVLQVIENPVRRKIIKRLSEEPSYALQISKELGLGQPLVSKHLAIMEKAGLVNSTIESSPTGPDRRRYSLAKSVSITMDLAPHLFKERAVSFDPSSLRETTGSDPMAALGKRAQEALSKRDEKRKLSLISKVMGDIDDRIDEVEEERISLLSMRNAMMSEAARIVGSLEDLDTRRVFFHILEEHDREVDSISQSLELREKVVQSILDEIQREFFG